MKQTTAKAGNNIRILILRLLGILNKTKSKIISLYCLQFFYIVNPFPHTTILQPTNFEHILSKHLNLYNWMDNPWLQGENIVAKGEIARYEQFLLLSLFFFSNSRGVRKRLYINSSSVYGKTSFKYFVEIILWLVFHFSFLLLHIIKGVGIIHP